MQTVDIAPLTIYTIDLGQLAMTVLITKLEIEIGTDLLDMTEETGIETDLRPYIIGETGAEIEIRSLRDQMDQSMQQNIHTRICIKAQIVALIILI